MLTVYTVLDKPVRFLEKVKHMTSKQTNRKAFEHVMANVRLRRQWYQLKRKAVRHGSVAAAFAAVVTQSVGCVAVVGTPEGIRAYGDQVNGLVTNGKASPDIKSAYWQQREAREVQETQRVTDSFLVKLFKGGE